MPFRESTIVVIETGRASIRAGLGIHELIKTPAVEVTARVGLRRDALTATVKDYLVGTQLDEALATNSDIVVSWPFAEGYIKDWTQAEALWKYVLFNQLQRRRVQNESPVLLSIGPGISRDEYERICQMFFERFNVAGFGILERPMGQIYAANSLSGVVVDISRFQTDITPIYEGFIARHARTSTSVGTSDCERYLAHLLRSNQSVMAAISPLEAPLEPQDEYAALVQLASQVWREGHVKVPSDGETAAPEDEGVTDIAAVIVAGKERALIESGMKKRATAKASAAEQARAREIEALDLITIQFREHSITLGKERHRFCEPLFDPTLLRLLPATLTESPPQSTGVLPWPLQEAVGYAVAQTEVDQRQYIWGGLFVTGEITQHVKGIGIALQSRVAPFLVNPDLPTEVQSRTVRVLNVADYFPEYRDTGNGFAAFLGASITAKITFNESMSRCFVSKADYSSRGPRSLIEMAPALL
ncbi:actin-related protein [Mycena amicta]|nr:actin-related protein [Mycena amicta]